MESPVGNLLSVDSYDRTKEQMVRHGRGVVDGGYPDLPLTYRFRIEVMETMDGEMQDQRVINDGDQTERRSNYNVTVTIPDKTSFFLF